MSANSLSFEGWKREVDRLMLAEYAIDTVDAGIENDRLRGHWTDLPLPNEFVTWFAEKYDLTPLKSWGWYIPPI